MNRWVRPASACWKSAAARRLTRGSRGYTPQPHSRRANPNPPPPASSVPPTAPPANPSSIPSWAPKQKDGLALRSLLVTSSVGLATPLFTIGGVVRLYYYLPISNAVKLAITVVAGGGIVYILYSYVIPFHLNHAELILPFALANASVAGCTYALLEAGFGFPAVIQFPWLGAAIGTATAVLAPLLWPQILPLCLSRDFFEMCFPSVEPGQDDSAAARISFLRHLYYEFLIPVALPVGVLAGTALQTVLVPLSNGMVSHPQGWLVLAAINVTALGYYTVCRANTDDYWFELRTNKLGVHRSVNAKTGQILNDRGSQARAAALKRDIFSVVHLARAAVAWLRGTVRDSIVSAEGYGESVVMIKADVRTTDANAALTNGGGVAHPTSPLTLEVANQRSLLLPLVDGLVRFKHLQLSLPTGGHAAAASASELKALQSFMSQKYGIADVGGLIVDCEEALITARGPSPENSSMTPAARRVAAHSHPSTQLLLANLPLLESELRAELGYEVGGVESHKAVASRRWEAMLRRIYMGVGVVACVGLLSQVLGSSSR